MRLLPPLGTALALLGLFALSEFAGRHGLPTETTRRLVHITGAGTTALFPFYLRLSEVVALAIAFDALPRVDPCARLLGERACRGPTEARCRGLSHRLAAGRGRGLAPSCRILVPALILAFADPAASVLV